MANEGDSASSCANNTQSHSSNRRSACEGDNTFLPKSNHRPVYEGEAAEDDSQLACKPNKLGPLCPGITRQCLTSCVQVSPWSQAFLAGFSQGILRNFSEYCFQGSVGILRMLGTKLEYADFQFYIFKLLLYETAWVELIIQLNQSN